jgi:hypothetical protein
MHFFYEILILVSFLKDKGLKYRIMMCKKNLYRKYKKEKEFYSRFLFCVRLNQEGYRFLNNQKKNSIFSFVW